MVLGVDAVERKAVQDTMRQLHWGAAWLEVLIRRTQVKDASKESERLQTIFDLVVSAVEFDSFHASAMGLVTRMATRLGCDRVSIGFTSGRRIRVNVMSHTAEFGKQTNLVRAIGAAMDEAADQAATVVYPLPKDADPVVTRAHEELSRRHGSGAVCTVPLGDKGRFFGGLTLERPVDKPFDPATVELCEAVAAIAGPILETKTTRRALADPQGLCFPGPAAQASFGAGLSGPQAGCSAVGSRGHLFRAFRNRLPAQRHNDHRGAGAAGRAGPVQRLYPGCSRAAGRRGHGRAGPVFAR